MEAGLPGTADGSGAQVPPSYRGASLTTTILTGGR